MWNTTKNRRTIARFLRHSSLVGCLALTVLLTTAQSTPAAPSLGAFVFASERDGERDIFMDFGNGDVRNLTNSAADSGTFSLAFESFPALSHDHNWVAFRADEDESGEIYIVSTAGGVPQRVTSGGGVEIAPSWSPDDRYLMYLSDKSGPRSIHILELETGIETRLTLDDAAYHAPSWSADGRSIAYMVQWTDTWAIQTKALETGTTKTLYTGTGDGYAWPEWSPDGTEIALAIRGQGPTGYEFYSLNPETGTMTLLTDSEEWLYKISWTEDGQWILFDSVREGNPDIFALSRDGANVVRVTTDPALDIHPG